MRRTALATAASPPPSRLRDRRSPATGMPRGASPSRAPTTTSTTTAPRTAKCAKTPSAAPTRWTSTQGATAASACARLGPRRRPGPDPDPGVGQQRRRRAPPRLGRAHRHCRRPDPRRRSHDQPRRELERQLRDQRPTHGDAHAEHEQRRDFDRRLPRFRDVSREERRPDAEQRGRSPRRDDQRRRHVDVSGDHWDGAGLDVETRNGGIRLTLPKGFSAELEAGTTHGGISVDFPVTVQGRGAATSRRRSVRAARSCGRSRPTAA